MVSCCKAFLFATVMALAGCVSPECQNQSTSHTDELGDTPGSLGGLDLQCRYDTDHFSIYYNTTALDSAEGVSGAAIEQLEDNLECVWDLYTEMAPASNRFADPRTLSFAEHTVTRIPVRVSQVQNGSPLTNAGSNDPILRLTPFGGNFGCLKCATQGYDTNAFHEFGHLMFKSYNRYFNSGPVDFVNEALPAGIVNIPLDPAYTRATPILANGTDLQAFIDLSDQSLRTQEYHWGAPFWYFLAMTYTQVTGPDHDYPDDDVSEQCLSYASAIRSTPPLKIRRLPGRDVVLRIQEAFSACHPAGLDTPFCTDSAGDLATEVSCVTAEWPEGCVPEGFGIRGSRWSSEADKVGEAFMPWTLDLIDQALTGRKRFEADGLRYKAFRDFLTVNFLRGTGGDSTFVDPLVAGAHRFRLKSFGAHYHEEGTEPGTAWRINIDKDGDMPDWAYSIFYVDGVNVQEQVAWSSDDIGVHVVLPYTKTGQIVTAVTAFEGTYSGGAFTDSGAHYSLTMERISLTVTEPSAGAAGQTSEPILIRWLAEGFSTPVHIYYSPDSGVTWHFVNIGVDNDGKYLWSLHHLGPGTYRFRIRSAGIPEVMAESADLQLTRGSIAVSSPAAGQELYRNEGTSIVWTSNLGGNVAITLDHTTAATLARSTPNNGSYTTRIGLPTGTYGYELNICSIEHPTICGSVAPLAVHDRGLILRYPLAENSLFIGDPYELRWETHGAGERVRIELSRDAGRTWSNISDSVENTGLYRWMVTAPITTQGLFRVTSLDSHLSDRNDGLFHIAERMIEVVSPNGGETLTSGAVHTIRWTDNFDNPQSGSTVKVHHSSGTDWTLLAEVANTGSYPWTVPAVSGSNHLIRVSHSLAGASDVSDAPFTIVP